ncbi:MAG: sialidase family protein [Longimicrobiales bacterium]
MTNLPAPGCSEPSCSVGRRPWLGLPMLLVLPVLILAAMPPARETREVYPHTVVRVTEEGFRSPAELSVAVNPADPDNVVFVSLASGPPGGARTTNYAYVSRDGGLSWETVVQPNPQGRTQGDDAVTFDALGRAYRSYISFDGIRVARPARAWNGIFVSRSDDGGLTWQSPVPVVDHINTVEPFEDKPWLVTDNAPGSPHFGNLYVAWTRFDVYGSPDPADSTQILFSRSLDAGRSFSVPFRISDSGGDAVDSDDTVEGAVPAVGPGGEVYVAWAGPLGIVFDRSLDGGWTFGEDRVVSDNPGGWDIPVPGMARHNGMPVTAVDPSQGPDRGTVYVNWIDTRNGDPDVFVAASRDGGDSWSAPVRVNNDSPANGKAQLFTWMAVDPVDGSVNVVFLDRRNTEGTAQEVTLARSTDGGRTFRNLKVDQEPFSCSEAVFYGDYLAIAAHGGRVVAGWPHCLAEGSLALSAALFEF